MHRFTDIHTHVPGIEGSVLSLPVSGVMSRGMECKAGIERLSYNLCYSLELHPWFLTHFPAGAKAEAPYEAARQHIDAFCQTARRLAPDPHFVAIGECGLDALCSTPLPLQHEAFLAALRMAHELHKPVIIHCVRLWADMLHDVSQVLTPQERIALPVILHGFRKGPALAQQMLSAGLSISLGMHYHPEVRTMVPSQYLYFETDQQEPPHHLT